MKKYVTLSRLAVVLCLGVVALSGCKSDEAPLSPQEAQVHFVLGGITTRTVTESDFTTKFVAADEIGIYATGAADGYNEKFTVADEGTLYSESNIYYLSSSGTANFYAYYPYCEQANKEGVFFNVPSDQTTEAQFNKADFMTAVSSGVAAGTQNIELKFRHQLTLIQVEVSKGQNIPVADGIRLQAQTGLAWNYLQSAYSAYSNDYAHVDMWKRGSGEDSYTFWALVPPQVINARTKFITINCGEESYTFTTKSAIELQANTVKKFNIKIADDGSLVVFSNDIICGEWDQNGSVIEGEGSLVVPNTLMELQDFEYFSATDLTKNKEQISGPGWWRLVQDNTTSTVEIIDEPLFATERGKVMHIKRTAITGWHNATYYYCVQNVNRIDGHYQLSFKARSSESENMKANQLRIGAFMQTSAVDEESGKTVYTDYYPMIINAKGEEVTTVYHQVLTADEYQTYTINFNLSKVSTLNKGAAADVTEESKTETTDEMLGKVVLYISCNAANVDFWIDDISWMPEVN